MLQLPQIPETHLTSISQLVLNKPSDYERGIEEERRGKRREEKEGREREREEERSITPNPNHNFHPACKQPLTTQHHHHRSYNRIE